MVLGPSCGLILADLGADVVKVEPAPGGDKTRQLPGSGSGFFGAFNFFGPCLLSSNKN